MRPAARLRERLPPQTAFRLRQLGRLRMLTKARLLRGYGHSWRRAPLAGLRYVLLDPEVGDFSYQLRNESEFAAGIARALDFPRERVEGLFAEARADPVMHFTLTRRVRWRFDTKRRIELGPRIGWYAIVRLARPRLVVETGVKHGIGSLVLLSALRRNEAEGGEPGRLISVDSDPFAGWLVPEALRGGWTRLTGVSTEVLDSALADEHVDLFVHDTTPGAENERREYEIALRHAAPGLILLSGSNGNRTTVLPELARRVSASYHLVEEEPDHFYDGAGMGLVLLPGGPA